MQINILDQTWIVICLLINNTHANCVHKNKKECYRDIDDESNRNETNWTECTQWHDVMSTMKRTNDWIHRNIYIALVVCCIHTHFDAYQKNASVIYEWVSIIVTWWYFIFHFDSTVHTCQPFVSMSVIIVYLFVYCSRMSIVVVLLLSAFFASNGIPLMNKCDGCWQFLQSAEAHNHFQFLFTFFFTSCCSATTVNGAHFMWEVFISIAACQSFQ